MCVVTLKISLCIISIVLFMCPKQSTTLVNKRQNNNSVEKYALGQRSIRKASFYKPPNIRLLPGYKFKPEDLIILGMDKPSSLKVGFDLNDEEIEKFKLWKNGVVPYYIDVPSFADKVLRDKIRSFLNVVSSVSGLSFVELPRPPRDSDDSRWVFFVNRRSQLTCADHSVKDLTTSGVQRVVLGYDCISIGADLAEAVLAIAGVPPQHNAPDRDEYIEIVWDNIKPDKKYLFEKLRDQDWLFHDINYDFKSAGHFHTHKHSVNGQVTIRIKDGTAMKEPHVLSDADILKIKMLYDYISRSSKKNRNSDCLKLFKRGGDDAFDTQSLKMPELPPLPKPNKYLGVASDASEGSDGVIGSEKNSDENVITGDKEEDSLSKDEIASDNVGGTLNSLKKKASYNFDESSSAEGINENPGNVKLIDKKPSESDSDKNWKLLKGSGQISEYEEMVAKNLRPDTEGSTENEI